MRAWFVPVTLWSAGLLLATASGCSDASNATPAGSKPAATSRAVAAAPTGSAGRVCGCGEQPGPPPGGCVIPADPSQCGEHEPAQKASCDEEPSVEGASDVVQERTDPTGRKVQHVGGELTDAELVTVEDVVSSPEKLAGKTIRLEGNVSAMCGGRRAWFALVGQDQSGTSLRAITAPAFLVPAGSIGKQARVEGKVEVTELSAKTAKHLAEEHKLPAAKGEADRQQVVLRATVAEFW